MPSRLEGLLSLLVASPMPLLGCTPETLPADTEGTSSGEPAESSSSSTGVAESTSTSSPLPDDTTSTGSTSSTGDPETSTTDASTSSSTSGDSTSTSTSEGESTTTGGETGNTCERVGDLMDMCFGGGGYYGYGSWYEYSCNWYINDYIAAGDIECAQAWNEFYACVADLDCAEVNMGVYSMCDDQYDGVQDVCFDWGESYGEDDFGFIVPETDSWFGTSDGGWGGTDDGGWVTTDGGWATTDGGWGGST